MTFMRVSCKLHILFEILSSICNPKYLCKLKKISSRVAVTVEKNLQVRKSTKYFFLDLKSKTHLLVLEHFQRCKNQRHVSDFYGCQMQTPHFFRVNRLIFESKVLLESKNDIV